MFLFNSIKVEHSSLLSPDCTASAFFRHTMSLAAWEVIASFSAHPLTCGIPKILDRLDLCVKTSLLLQSSQCKGILILAENSTFSYTFIVRKFRFYHSLLDRREIMFYFFSDH